MFQSSVQSVQTAVYCAVAERGLPLSVKANALRGVGRKRIIGGFSRVIIIIKIITKIMMILPSL